MPKHIAIIIPGLGDDSINSVKRIELLTNHWIKYGITPLIHAVKWRDGESFQPKLIRLLELIDSLIAKSIDHSTVFRRRTSFSGHRSLCSYTYARNCSCTNKFRYKQFQIVFCQWIQTLSGNKFRLDLL